MDKGMFEEKIGYLFKVQLITRSQRSHHEVTIFQLGYFCYVKLVFWPLIHIKSSSIAGIHNMLLPDTK